MKTKWRSGISLIPNTYSHIFSGMQEESATRLDELGTPEIVGGEPIKITECIEVNHE